MKHKYYLVQALLFIAVASAQSQTINWKALKKEDRHFIHLNAGLLHGLNFGAGYSYKINQRLFPVLLNADITVPTGSGAAEDFKLRLGGHIRWVKLNDFQFSASLHGIFRRYENEFVRLANFGAAASGVAGIYRPRWFAAAEFGFDKAIVTHFKHTNAYKAQYPEVINGWYEPATGGNIFYGLMAGYSFRRNEIHIRAGKTYAEDFKTKPLVPIYGQLGYTLKF